MLSVILDVINFGFKLFGMQEQRRKEINKAILRDALAYQKDGAAASRIRGEYRDLIDEIRRENRDARR